jgi:hypothetical protein
VKGLWASNLLSYMFSRVNQPPRPADWIPPPLRARLDTSRDALLSVHKALLDHERARYERTMGPIESAGRLLQLVIHDPWFAWLHPMTELVVQIDELVTAKEPAPPGAAEALLEQARRLFNPAEDGDEFQRHYYEAMQQAPAVVLAHAEAVKRLARPQ